MEMYIHVLIVSFCTINAIRLASSYRFIQGDCSKGWVLCENGVTSVAAVTKSNKRCIIKNWICDKGRDCADGSDEKYCPYNFESDESSLVSNTGSVTTSVSGEAVSTITVPSLSKSHSNYDDIRPDIETTTSRLQTYRLPSFRIKSMLEQGECRDDWVMCENGNRRPNALISSEIDKCIKIAWVCDGHNDCEDKSDEKYCVTIFSDLDFARQTTTPSPRTAQTVPPRAASDSDYTPSIHSEISLFVQKVEMKLKRLDEESYLNAERLINQVLFAAQKKHLADTTDINFCNKNIHMFRLKGTPE